MVSILYARISDNVLDPEDWPVRKLVVGKDRIIAHIDLHAGVHDFSTMPASGWTLEQLLAWAARDNTGTHPEVCYDLKAEGEDRYEYYVYKREQLDLLLKRGEVKEPVGYTSGPDYHAADRTKTPEPVYVLPEEQAALKARIEEQAELVKRLDEQLIAARTTQHELLRGCKHPVYEDKESFLYYYYRHCLICGVNIDTI